MTKQHKCKFYQTWVSLFHWFLCAAPAAKSLQSCPTLYDPRDGSPPGFPVPGILQARTLEWVDISFSNAWKWKVKGKSLSRSQLLATPWTAAHQAPLSMGFSRQEYWSGVPCKHILILKWNSSQMSPNPWRPFYTSNSFFPLHKVSLPPAKAFLFHPLLLRCSKFQSICLTNISLRCSL